MLQKRSIAVCAFVMTSNVAFSAELLPIDPISARIFLEHHSIQQLAGDIR